VLGEEREVDARAVPRRAQRVGLPGPDLHSMLLTIDLKFQI
jgi:hypothetical protein